MVTKRLTGYLVLVLAVSVFVIVNLHRTAGDSKETCIGLFVAFTIFHLLHGFTRNHPAGNVVGGLAVIACLGFGLVVVTAGGTYGNLVNPLAVVMTVISGLWMFCAFGMCLGTLDRRVLKGPDDGRWLPRSFFRIPREWMRGKC